VAVDIPGNDISAARREFILRFLESLQSISLDDFLTTPLRAQVRDFSRGRMANTFFMRLLDLTRRDVERALAYIMENLESKQLPHLVSAFLQNLAREAGDGSDGSAADDQATDHRTYDEKMRSRLRHFAHTRLTTIPDEELEEQIAIHFHDDNPFENLFLTRPSVSLRSIRNFLLTSDFLDKKKESVHIRGAISQFVRDHQLDGVVEYMTLHPDFKPSNIEYWKEAMTPEFVADLPVLFWKNIHTLQQLLDFRSKFLKTSFNMDIFTKLFFKKPPTATTTTTKPPAGGEPIGKKILHFTDIDMFYRLRPHVRNLVAVLLRPADDDGNANQFLGPEWKKGYYFPSELFYQALSDPETIVRHENDTMILQRDAVRTPILVYHLLGNGSLIQETASQFARGQEFLEKDHSWITISGSREHILSSLLLNLSEQDNTILVTKIRNDMSVLLSSLYTEKLDTDKIAMTIESAIHDRIVKGDKTVRDYLASIFQVMLMIDPRYQFSSNLFPGNKQRIDRFLYRLDAMGDIPIVFLYPSYEKLAPMQKKAMDSYIESNTQFFISTSILHLFRVAYPYLRVPTTQALLRVVPPPFSIAPSSSLTEDDSMMMQVFHDGDMVNLRTIAAAILTGDDDELVVHGKTIDPSFLHQVQSIFDLKRCMAGVTVILIPTGFEMTREADAPLATEDYKTDDKEEEIEIIHDKNDFVQEENLVHFKKHAMDFMRTLLSS